MSGFSFAKPGAEGSAPKTGNGLKATVISAPTYTIYLREFIRANYILGPLPCVPIMNLQAGPFLTYFHGDSRNFLANPLQESPPSNPYRAQQGILVQPETAVSPSGSGGVASWLSGTTRQYDSGSFVVGNDPAGSGVILNPAIPDNVVVQRRCKSDRYWVRQPPASTYGESLKRPRRCR